MAINRLDPKGGGEAASGGGKPATSEAPVASAPAAPPSGGGVKAMLPLLLNLVLMPVLAYFMTVKILVPKLGHGAPAAAAAKSEAGGEGHEAGGNTKEGSKGKEKGGKAKVVVPLSKNIIVNVKGTMATRYLAANISLVGMNADLEAVVKKNDAQLRDAAGGCLSGKTITDLEKPGARNQVRAELINLFNSVLGDGMVTELYFTEFAIQ